MNGSTLPSLFLTIVWTCDPKVGTKKSSSDFSDFWVLSSIKSFGGPCLKVFWLLIIDTCYVIFPSAWVKARIYFWSSKIVSSLYVAGVVAVTGDTGGSIMFRVWG